MRLYWRWKCPSVVGSARAILQWAVSCDGKTLAQREFHPWTSKTWLYYFMSSTVILLFLLVWEGGKWIKLTIKQNSYCRLYPFPVFAYVCCTVRPIWRGRSTRWIPLSPLTEVRDCRMCVGFSYSASSALTFPPIIRLTMQRNHCRAMSFHISDLTHLDFLLRS